MKAIVYHGNKDVRFDSEFPEPKIIHPTQVKIKVDYCGICGSDLHEYIDGPIFFKNEYNAISHNYYQQVMGHEISGEIVELGAEADPQLKVGQKVVVEATGTCVDKAMLEEKELSQCGSCSQGYTNACDFISFYGLGFDNGGFSEYMVIGDHHLIPYPEELLPPDIAALTEPLAVGWHGVRTSPIKPGESALILGAGPIGLSTIFALKGNNIGLKNIVICEPAAARRKLAASFGVTVFDPSPFNDDESKLTQELLRLSSDGWGFHHIYDCSGNKVTFDMSISALRTGGTATNLAIWHHKPIPFYPMDLTLHEKFITGSMCYTRRDFEQVIQAYKDGLINPEEVKTLITAKIPIESGFKDGFLELVNHKDKHIKILVTPHLHS
ncbi:sorbitol dehydrogenase [Scheffersomyces amazonensis]|uniref:sorbitol dehydrogenase n=1 Tax=Scheffersomyces amazonensis TaxID=1078765 RepID=UPI00315C66B2